MFVDKYMYYLSRISMLRTTLEIIYLLNILYLSFHYYKLFLNVVKLRRKTKVTIGFKSKKLERAIRAHSNFCETVPFILLVSFILYFNNLLIFATASTLTLSLGRKIHSKAISDINENIIDRRKGMRLTMLSLAIGFIGIAFYISKLIFFYYQSSFYTTYLPQFLDFFSIYSII